MKNLLNKIRKNNKGFTLVELIIVVAILAVLMAVLAPQYIRYVEKSRQGTDASALNEIKHAVEIEAALVEDLPEGSITIDGTDGTLASVAPADYSDLIDQVEKTVGDSVEFKSDVTTANDYTIVIDENGAVDWDGWDDATNTYTEGSTGDLVSKLASGTATASED